MSHSNVASRMPVDCETVVGGVRAGRRERERTVAGRRVRAEERCPVEGVRGRAADPVAVDLEPGIDAGWLKRRGCRRPRADERYQQGPDQCTDGDDRSVATYRHVFPIRLRAGTLNMLLPGTASSESRGSGVILGTLSRKSQVRSSLQVRPKRCPRDVTDRRREPARCGHPSPRRVRHAARQGPFGGVPAGLFCVTRRAASSSSASSRTRCPPPCDAARIPPDVSAGLSGSPPGRGAARRAATGRWRDGTAARSTAGRSTRHGRPPVTPSARCGRATRGRRPCAPVRR